MNVPDCFYHECLYMYYVFNVCIALVALSEHPSLCKITHILGNINNGHIEQRSN
jgi:hypothetical protein